MYWHRENHVDGSAGFVRSGRTSECWVGLLIVKTQFFEGFLAIRV